MPMLTDAAVPESSTSWEARSVKGGVENRSRAVEVSTERVLDLRMVPLVHKEGTIRRVIDGLAPGGGFTLIDNEDPEPLLRASGDADGIVWACLLAGPRVWRVRVERSPE